MPAAARTAPPNTHTAMRPAPWKPGGALRVLRAWLPHISAAGRRTACRGWGRWEGLAGFQETRIRRRARDGCYGRQEDRAGPGAGIKATKVRATGSWPRPAIPASVPASGAGTPAPNTNTAPRRWKTSTSAPSPAPAPRRRRRRPHSAGPRKPPPPQPPPLLLRLCALRSQHQLRPLLAAAVPWPPGIPIRQCPQLPKPLLPSSPTPLLP